jgi:hypothetical protein
MYHVRRVNTGKTAQLDELAHACGELYSKMLVFFWQMVRHKRRWLKPKHLMPQYKPSLLPLRVGGSATRRIQPPNLCASASGREPPRSVTSVYASGKNIVPKKYGVFGPCAHGATSGPLWRQQLGWSRHHQMWFQSSATVSMH